MGHILRAKEKKFTFPYLFDEGQKIYPQYGATKTPHVFLLDKNLVVKYIGAIDDNVEDASQVKEKYLENACIDNKCTDGGNVVVMNPNNGDILAMATYPNYDLNNPYEIENSQDMDSKERNKQLQAKWRNKAIADAGAFKKS